MHTEKKTRGTRKRDIAITAILLPLSCGLLFYYEASKRPVLIDSGIIEHRLTFSAHSDVVSKVIFSPDSELLASGSVDNTVKIWQRKDGNIVRTLEHPMGVTALAFSRDGRHLATGSF